MSNYEKNYSVGQIRLDAPYAHFLYTLPLLSFSDAQHAIDLSLVYQSKMTDNPFNIANGYKLSLQKRIVLSSVNIPEFLEDGNGSLIKLSGNSNVYITGDDSKRIIRKTGNTYTLENPDYSREIYDYTGKITSLIDKYNETYLTFSYLDSKLNTITYKSTKVLSLEYNDSGMLESITYEYNGSNVCEVNFSYPTSSSVKVAHYSDVDYNLSFANNEYVAFSANTGDSYTESYYQKISCTVGTDMITAKYMVGPKTVNLTTYSFITYSTSIAPKKFNLLDITDFYGIKTRIQYENEKPAYSYEIAGDMFVENSPNNNYSFNGQVNIHNNRSIRGSISYGEGIDVVYYPNPKNWYLDLSSVSSISEYFVISGWLKPVGQDTSCNIYIYDDYTANTAELQVTNLNSGRWTFFSFCLASEYYKELNIRFTDINGEMESRDLRVTYQEPVSENPECDNRITQATDVLIANSNVLLTIPLADLNFYNGTTRINQPITSNDILKYLLNEKKGASADEIYYNDCKGIIKGAQDLIAKSKEQEDVIYNVKDYCVGQVYFRGTRKNVIKHTVKSATTNPNDFLITESFCSTALVSTAVYNSNLDLVSLTSDGNTTVYVRNAKGLVTSKTINDDIGTEVSYDDSSTKITSTKDEFDNTTSYVTNDTWGVITSSTLDDTIISDSYDSDMTDLTAKTFTKGSYSKTNQFGYSNGNLASITQGDVNYTFGYTAGNLTEIRKFGSIIESRDYSNNNKTVLSSYPSSENPIYTVEQKIDNYGRLSEITGVLKNTYSISPKYENGTYSATNVDNRSGKLAISEDLATGKKMKYAYNGNRISKIGVFNSSNTKTAEQSFTYDTLERVTSNEFVYSISTSGQKSVKADIEYDTTTADTNPDSRIKVCSYKLNGIEKAKTQNRYNDPYKRLSAKLITVGSTTYDKGITYSKTRIAKVMDVKNGSTFHNVSYTYDALGRITDEVDSTDTSFNNHYIYDSYGRLIQENNKSLDKTYVYEYNESGNIIGAKAYNYTTESVDGVNPISTDSYTYDSTVKDRLTVFKGDAITYDSMGYPIKLVDGSTTYTYTWTKGKLTGFSKFSSIGGRHSYTYTYDAYGRRIRKLYTFFPGAQVSVVYTSRVTTNYTYDLSGRLIKESVTEVYSDLSNSTRESVYLYDENSIVGVDFTQNGSTSTYYFDRNIKGDVIGIYNASGTQIAKYSYDSWGNSKLVTLVTNNFSAYNPILYRGYYFDAESGFYFLNARYYNPAWRRFISPDNTAYLDPDTPSGLNLYAYCNNDPANIKNIFENEGIINGINRANQEYEISQRSTLQLPFTFNQKINEYVTVFYIDGYVNSKLSLKFKEEKQLQINFGVYGKFSAVNVKYPLSVYDNYGINLSADIQTATAMAGIIVNPNTHTYFIGFDVKAAFLIGKFSIPFDIFDIPAEAGGSLSVGAIGATFGIGIVNGKLRFEMGSAALLGFEVYFTMDLEKLFD